MKRFRLRDITLALTLALSMAATAGWWWPLRRHTPALPRLGLFIGKGLIRADPRLKSAGPGGAALKAERFPILIVQFKDSDGVLLHCSQTGKKYGLESLPKCRSVEEIVAPLAESGFKVIAYLQTFKDLAFANRHPSEALQNADGTVFKDDYGAFIDPLSKVFEQYFFELTEELSVPGVSGIMLDYVRFAESKYLAQRNYPYSQQLSQTGREKAITDFAARLRIRLKRLPQPKELWAAVFPYGFVGQDLQILGDIFDVLSPMIYPEIIPGRGKVERDVWHSRYQLLVAEYRRQTQHSRARSIPFMQAFSFDHDGRRIPLPATLARWQLAEAARHGFEEVLLFDSRSRYTTFWDVTENRN